MKKATAAPRMFVSHLVCNRCNSKTLVGCRIDYVRNLITVDANKCSNCNHKFETIATKVV